MKPLKLAPIFFITILLLITLSVSSVSFAEKGGNGKGGGKPGGEDPDCSSDKYPGTVYENEGKRNEPSKIFLTSEDGCLPEILIFEATDDFRGSLQMHWNGVKGIIIWREEPGNGAQYNLQHVEFTLDDYGYPKVSEEAHLLNLFPEDEDLPSEDLLFYHSPDLWGKGSLLYIVVKRLYEDISEETGTFELWLFNISNLSDFSDSRMIFTSDDWDCTGVDHPETTAACYGPDDIRWTPSGTRFYLHDNMDDTNGVRWDGIVRMDITQGGTTLDDWTFGLRELVGTSARTDTSTTSELSRFPRLKPGFLPFQIHSDLT